MSHWTFVIAAYAIAIIATVALTWASFRDMRRAEDAAAALRDET